MRIIGRINYNMQGDYIKIPYNDLNQMKKENYLEKMNEINESRKAEEPIIRQLAEKTNRTCVAIQNIKNYMNNNSINYQ